MNEIVKSLNKYIILLIISSFFGTLWIYGSFLIFKNIGSDSIINYLPTCIDYFIRLIIIILLIIDFKKYDLQKVAISCSAALFSPLLGIVTFGLLLLSNEKKKVNQ